MTADDTHRITDMLDAWRRGEPEAETQLMQAVYPVMREIARARLRRTPQDMTLSATELANEAYTKLNGINDHDWKNRVHFFAVTARAVRNIVIDHLRASGREKRGSDLPFVSLQDVDIDSVGDSIDLGVDWLSVHQALNELELLDRGGAQIVELKFFSGLTTDEIADAVGISRATVVRNWRFARAWLADRLKGSETR